MEAKDIIILILGIFTALWTFASFFLLHRQNKDSEIFKKKLEVYRNYINITFGIKTTNQKSVYSEIFLICNNKVLNAIIEFNKFNSDTDSFEVFHSNLLSSIRSDLNLSVKKSKDTLKEYSSFLSLMEDETNKDLKDETNKDLKDETNKDLKDETNKDLNIKIYKFKDIFTSIRGSYIKNDDLIKFNKKGDYFYYIKVSNINSKFNVNLLDKYYLTDKLKSKTYNFKNIKDDLFLLPKVGKIGKIGYHSMSDENIIISDNIYSFYYNYNDSISIGYLKTFLKTKYFYNKLSEGISGTAVQFLNNKYIQDLNIPVLDIKRQEDFKYIESDNNKNTNDISKKDAIKKTSIEYDNNETINKLDYLLAEYFNK